MRSFKTLCQDIIECATDMLSKDSAIDILQAALKDLGWTPTDATSADDSFSMFGADIKKQPMATSPRRSPKISPKNRAAADNSLFMEEVMGSNSKS